MTSSVACAWIGTRAHAAVELAHDAGDRGLHLQQILARLEQQQIDAALDEVARLLAVELGEFVEGDLRERRIGRRDEHARRAHRAGDEARPLRRRRSGRHASRASRGRAWLISAVWSPRPYSSSLRRESRERVGLDDVRAGREIRSWIAGSRSGRVRTSASLHPW